MAEGEGFEPPVRLPAQRFSRPPHSTTLASLRYKEYQWLRWRRSARTNGNIATRLPPNGVRGAARLSRGAQLRQSCIDSVCGLAVVLPEEVRINLQCDGGIGMAQAFADRHDVDTGVYEL